MKTFYYFAAFVSGMVVMAAELSATRLMAPYFGDSLYVWTNVIAIVLLALSFGYFFGGKLADRFPKGEMYHSLLLTAGAWLLALPFLSQFFLESIMESSPNLQWAIIGGSFLGSLLLFAVPMFFLAALVPYTVKLAANGMDSLGQVSGRISMVSTFGSLLGTFLPAFILIPLLGTARSYVLLGALLILTAFIGKKQRLLFVMTLLLCGLLFWKAPHVFSKENMIYSQETAYGHIFVIEKENGVRSLHIDHTFGAQSVYDPSGGNVGYYYEMAGDLAAAFPDFREALILGHAGGAFTRYLNQQSPQMHVTGVELSPAVTQAARETMALEDLKVSIVHADARSYLNSDAPKYDLIFADAYHALRIPSHLATHEFFELNRAHLNEGGVLILNVAASESTFQERLKQTVLAAFPYVYEIEVPETFNQLIVASEAALPELLPGQILLSKNEEFKAFDDEHLTEVELSSMRMWLALSSRFVPSEN